VIYFYFLAGLEKLMNLVLDIFASLQMDPMFTQFGDGFKLRKGLTCPLSSQGLKKLQTIIHMSRTLRREIPIVSMSEGKTSPSFQIMQAQALSRNSKIDYV